MAIDQHVWRKQGPSRCSRQSDESCKVMAAALQRRTEQHTALNNLFALKASPTCSRALPGGSGPQGGPMHRGAAHTQRQWWVGTRGSCKTSGSRTYAREHKGMKEWR